MKLSELRQLMHALPPSTDPNDPALRELLLQQAGFDPRSFYQELEMDSPYINTHRDVSSGSNFVSLHSHSFYEILYCCSSCNTEYLVGQARYRLQKGDILLLLPGVSHGPLLSEHMEQPYSRIVLWISTELMSNLKNTFPEFVSPLSGETPLLRTAGTHWEFLGELFQNGVREAEAGGPDQSLMVMGNTLTLLGHLRRAFLDQGHEPLRAEQPDLLDQTMAFVTQHLQEKLSLADVARSCFVSESTISQTFRKRLGISYYQYVTQQRLMAAKLLIQDGIMLDEVSRQSGFSEYSSFYRAFKKEFGISPRQYRLRKDGE